MLNLLSNCLRVLLPRQCTICLGYCHASSGICPECEQNLPFLSHACIRCANLLPARHEPLCCGSCLKDPPPFTKSVAVFQYALPIPALIWQLKFHRKYQLATLLAHYLTNAIQTAYQRDVMPDAIIPIPLHRKRLAGRGYNQALEIAKPLSRSFHIPMLLRHVVRVKETLPQSSLSALERKANMRSVFRVTQAIPCQHVAIVDDVATTGATISALAALLVKAGVKRVDAWFLARA